MRAGHDEKKIFFLGRRRNTSASHRKFRSTRTFIINPWHVTTFTINPWHATKSRSVYQKGHWRSSRQKKILGGYKKSSYFSIIQWGVWNFLYLFFYEQSNFFLVRPHKRTFKKIVQQNQKNWKIQFYIFFHTLKSIFDQPVI